MVEGPDEQTSYVYGPAKLAAAIFIRQHVLRWPPLTLTRDRGNNGQSTAAASRGESEKRPHTGGRREMQTARATGGGGGGRRQALQLPGEQTDGRQGGRQPCICQVVGDRQVIRRPRWMATNVRRPCGRTDEFFNYSGGSRTLWLVKQ